VLTNHPKELPPFHQQVTTREFTPYQWYLVRKWRLDLLFQSDEQFSIECGESTAIGERLERRAWLLYS
jgi:hypothetical protein